ncbi:FtsX-like permease family protein [candidate division KSB1 bacterium]|nr:FtsX-like permease family protein [candidate division KSB1 bacterium]
MSMLNNYLKIALRNIRKQKGYTFINVFGFTLGLTCTLLILMYVVHEWSYDRFHEKADRIYRITFLGKIGQHEFESAASGVPAADGFMQEFPQVETATRIDKMGEQVVRLGDRSFNEQDLLLADPNFFDVFSFRLLQGEPNQVLHEPHTVVLTERLALKYFGDRSPVGEMITVGKNKTDYKITGVVENPPQNSHFDFDALVSMAGMDWGRRMNWLNFSLYTYILLKENTSIDALEANLPALYEKYFTTPIQNVLQMSWQKFLEQGNNMGIVLQPLTSIHFNSRFNDELKPIGNKSNVFLFSLIAIFVLVIACINYMNLATARSASRAKEVGVRKVVGANRSALIKQFLSESLLLAIISMILSIGLVELLLPVFNELSGIHFSSGLFARGWVLAGLTGFTLLIGLLAGSYPALVLTLYQPIQVLRSKSMRGHDNRKLRSALVIFQFIISITLILSTAFVYKQLSFVRSKQLGFDKENVLIVQHTGRLGAQAQAFKQSVSQQTFVHSASLAEAVPARGGYNGTFYNSKEPDRTAQGFQVTEGEQICRHFMADPEYLQTLKFDLVKGRDFSAELSTDSMAVILNQAAVRVLGLNQPINKIVYATGQKDQPGYRVIGVVKDYHMQSLHSNIEPVVMHLGHSPRLLVVRLLPGDHAAGVEQLEKIWHQFALNTPFTYSFLDEDYDALFRAEVRFGKLVGYFALFTIFIACLGAFGLATFSAEQRTKEIGIRKTLGASIPNLILLLTREFSILVSLAFVIAVPLTYYAVQKWLQGFAYRIGIDVWTFIIAGIAAILIALLTVSFQAVRAAMANPVKALRYE